MKKLLKDGFSDLRKSPSSVDNGSEVIGYWRASSTVRACGIKVSNACQSSFRTSSTLGPFLTFSIPACNLFLSVGL